MGLSGMMRIEIEDSDFFGNLGAIFFWSFEDLVSLVSVSLFDFLPSDFFDFFFSVHSDLLILCLCLLFFSVRFALLLSFAFRISLTKPCLIISSPSCPLFLI